MKISVSFSDELIRIDLFLSQRLREFSRTNIQKMINNSHVRVNGELVKKNSILNYGDIIEVNLIEKQNNSNDYKVKRFYFFNIFALARPVHAASIPYSNNCISRRPRLRSGRNLGRSSLHRWQYPSA